MCVQMNQMRQKDRRTRIMTEILNGIKVVVPSLFEVFSLV